MKKSELKVGEEYAAFTRPSTARRSYRYDKPMRVKLVELNGELSDTFTARTTVYENGARVGTKDIEQEVKVYGIIAELVGDPITREVPDVIRPLHGKTKALIPAWAVDPPYRTYGSDEPEIGTHERKYQRVALENAGCFLMTWAQWEAQQVAEEEAKERRKNEHLAQVEREAANDPKMRAKLQAMVDALTARGLEVEPVTGYIKDDEVAWYDAKDAETHVAKVRLDLTYNHNGKLTRIEVQRMSTSLLAELLGVVDRKEEVS